MLNPLTTVGDGTEMEVLQVLFTTGAPGVPGNTTKFFH
jgi:hypothetical protein